MNLSKRAITETARELGFNIPTVATVVLGIALSIIAGEAFDISESDTVSGFQLWLIRSGAWVITISVVFTLRLVWNILQISRHDRTVRDNLEFTANLAESIDHGFMSFLRNELHDSKYGVARCYAFGSVVREYPTRDVDIIVQFDSSQERKIRTYRHRLRTVEKSFQEFYSRQLHVQMFLSDEDECLQRFLEVAEHYERIF